MDGRWIIFSILLLHCCGNTFSSPISEPEPEPASTKPQPQPEPQPEPQAEPEPSKEKEWFGDFLGSLPDPQSSGVKGDVYLVNETTLQIVNFSYSGQAPDLYFWADREPVLTSSGVKIPSFEFGVTPLGKYENAERVVLILPAHRKIDEFSTVGLWCLEFAKDFGAVKVDKSREPPKAQFLSHELRGKRYNVGSGPILILDRRTIKVFGFTFDGDKAPDGYFFVGKGKEPDHDKGVKVPIRGRDSSDMITAMNERYKGGQDLILDLPESHDIYSIDWLSVYCVKFRVDFGFVPMTNLSKRIPPHVPPQKRADEIDVAQQAPWPVTTLLGTDARTNFTFQVGPPGARRGYQSLARARPNENVWYINGYMTPELYLRRGVTYTFNVEGGDDKSTEKFYNPLYFSDDPFGGYMKLSADERKQVKILAGAPKDEGVQDGNSVTGPTSNVGRLCVWSQDNMEDDPDKYEQFPDYRQTLTLKCASEGSAGTFTWTPDANTPDIVYYQSFTHYNMGWKMHIVNEIPHDLPDFKEEPYKYEIWLEHQSLRELPRLANGAPMLGPIAAAMFMSIAIAVLTFLPRKLLA